MTAFNWLAAAAVEREAAGLTRVRRARDADEPLLDLAGNDYLGLARHPDVVAAGAAASRTWGAGSTGSRLVTGTTAVHEELEQELARFLGAEAALVFSSGYLANLGAVAGLAGRGDLVVSDAFAHASLVDACRLSRARVAVVAHADVGAVDGELASRAEPRALALTDSVYSVDGDSAPLQGLHDSARRYGAGLVVDEAHALGVVGPGGRGLVAAAGLEAEPDVVRTVTLSKALGSQGGAVLGPADVIEHLVNVARPFIFDTALAPASAAAALTALRLLVADPGLPTRCADRARELAAIAGRHGFDTTAPHAGVVSIRVGAPDRAVALGGALRRNGIRVGVFRPPSVPDGVARVRLTARADLTDADLELLDKALRELA